MGGTAVVAPLFVYRALPWTMPAEIPAAVMLTSAAAARLAGPALDALTDRPCHVVGAATAAAARAAGFATIITAGPDAEALLADAAARGVTDLLHLSGREHRHAGHDAIRITRRIVYAADAADRMPPAALDVLAGGATALLHSPRAARLFGTLVEAAGLQRTDIAIAAFSPAVAVAAGDGWRAVAVAGWPDDASLLAAAGLPCDNRGIGEITA